MHQVLVRNGLVAAQPPRRPRADQQFEQEIANDLCISTPPGSHWVTAPTHLPPCGSPSRTGAAGGVPCHFAIMRGRVPDARGDNSNGLSSSRQPAIRDIRVRWDTLLTSGALARRDIYKLDPKGKSRTIGCDDVA